MLHDCIVVSMYDILRGSCWLYFKDRRRRVLHYREARAAARITCVALELKGATFQCFDFVSLYTSTTKDSKGELFGGQIIA